MSNISWVKLKLLLCTLCRTQASIRVIARRLHIPDSGPWKTLPADWIWFKGGSQNFFQPELLILSQGGWGSDQDPSFLCKTDFALELSKHLRQISGSVSEELFQTANTCKWYLVELLLQRSYILYNECTFIRCKGPACFIYYIFGAMNVHHIPSSSPLSSPGVQ